MQAAPRITLRKPKRAAVDHDAFGRRVGLESLESKWECRMTISDRCNILPRVPFMIVIPRKTIIKRFQNMFHRISSFCRQSHHLRQFGSVIFDDGTIKLLVV